MWIRVGGAGSGPGLGVEGLEHPWYRRDLGSQCGQVRKRKASGASWITNTHTCEGSASPVDFASPVSFVVSYKNFHEPFIPWHSLRACVCVCGGGDNILKCGEAQE